MTFMQMMLAVIVPLVVALVQLQECFAYWMPWSSPALLPVSFEHAECSAFCPTTDHDPACITRAGIPNCEEIATISGTASVSVPPLWRGTCASAGYRLFAPQATLVLAIQAAQVLVLALIQWRSGRTVAQLASAAPGVALQYARRKGCCCCCHRAPTGRDAWLPRAAVRRSPAHSPARPAVAGHDVTSSLSAPLLATELPPSSSPLQKQVAQGQPSDLVVATVGAAAGDSLLMSGVVTQAASAHATDPSPPTFDSIQAHITLLVGGVFGAVYPAACLACAAAVGAYSLSWRLAPHAQGGDVPVPAWMRGAMVLVYTASVWFAYGPGSMLEGGSGEGALWALGCVTVEGVCMLVWLAVPSSVWSAWLAGCHFRCKRKGVPTETDAGDAYGVILTHSSFEQSSSYE